MQRRLRSSVEAQFTAARDAACTAIEKYPKSISAHAILLGASSALRDTGDPLSLIPEDLQSEAAIAYGIGNFYRWKTDAATARVWFARAFEKDPNTLEIKTAWAEQLLGDILGDNAAVATGQFSGQQLADLERAETLLLSIWDSVKGSDLAAPNVMTAINVSTSLRLSGKHKRAAEVLDEALEVVPDNSRIRTQRAFVALELKDYETSLAMLSGLSSMDAPLAPMMRADLLMRLNRQREAVDAIDEAIANAKDADLIVRAKRVRTAIITQVEGAQAGLEAAQDFVKEHDLFISRLTLAEALHANGDDTAALDAARNVKLEGERPLEEESLALATLLTRLRAYGEAAEIYGALVKEARDWSTLSQLDRLSCQCGPSR